MTDATGPLLDQLQGRPLRCRSTLVVVLLLLLLLLCCSGFYNRTPHRAVGRCFPAAGAPPQPHVPAAVPPRCAPTRRAVGPVEVGIGLGQPQSGKVRLRFGERDRDNRGVLA